MKVLVTGASGLVGKHLKDLVTKDEKWTAAWPELGADTKSRMDALKQADFLFPPSKELDCTDEKTVMAYFAEHQPTHVIHLAARVGGIFRNQRERVEMFQDNMRMTLFLLEASFKFKVQKFLGILSTCIFADGGPYPLQASSLHQGPPHPSNEPYAHAKRQLEVACRAYRDQHGCDYQCLIPTNLYGLWDNYDLEDGHVLPALLHQARLAKQAGNPWKIRGTGIAQRQFVHAEDFARACLVALTEPKDSPLWANGAVCISPAEEYTIKQVVDVMGDAVEIPQEQRVWMSEYTDGQIVKTADGSFFLQTFPWFKFRDFPQSISDWGKDYMRLSQEGYPLRNNSP